MRAYVYTCQRLESWRTWRMRSILLIYVVNTCMVLTLGLAFLIEPPVSTCMERTGICQNQPSAWLFLSTTLGATSWTASYFGLYANAPLILNHRYSCNLRSQALHLSFHVPAPSMGDRRLKSLTPRLKPNSNYNPRILSRPALLQPPQSRWWVIPK